MSFLGVRPRRPLRALVAVCAFAWGAPGFARAEASPAIARDTARGLADEGANAYAAGDYERALALFQRAQELVPAPTLVLWEARTLVRLGRLREARGTYRRLTGAELPADAPAQFRAAAASAEAELARLEREIPRLSVVVAGDAGEEPVVLLDGVAIAPSLLRGALLVDPGRHTLELRTARGTAAPVEVTLAEGEAKHVRLDAPRSTAADPRRTWGIAAIGVGGAGIALGVVAGIAAADAYGDAERGCPEGRCAAGSPGAAAVERFRDWRTVSTLGYVVGAVSAGAGVVLLLTSEDERGRYVAVVPGLGGARVEGTW